MKKIYVLGIATFLLASVTACHNRPASQNNQAADIHNAQISLDWNGVYEGLIPSAGGEGISVQLTLNTDDTYQLSYLYIGENEEPYVSFGSFTWDDNGAIITLDCDECPPYYLVGENELTQLDVNKEPITGDLASMYILKKQ